MGKPDERKHEISVVMLQDLARLLTPDSLSRLLVFADKVDWGERIVSDYEKALGLKWRAYFEEASSAFEDHTKNLNSSPENAREIVYQDLERYLDSLELMPCGNGCKLLYEIQVDQFQSHCETCDICRDIQSFLGWQPLFRTLVTEVTVLEDQQRVLLREDRTETVQDHKENLIRAIFGSDPELPLMPRPHPCT